MLKKQFESCNKHYTSEHRYAHGPMVTWLPIVENRLFEDVGHYEVNYNTFYKTPNQPSKQSVLIE